MGKLYYTDEIMKTVREVALDILWGPALPNSQSPEDKHYLEYNNTIAWRNSGILELVDKLKEALTESEGDQDAE